jgi:carbohydrate kinase (thermoresistant glucokinase family)
MGCGKTTVGKALSATTGWEFIEGDDFHPEKNVSKMAAGIPLTDEDRRPWLLALHDCLAQKLASNQTCILACSALKQVYRDLLGIDQQRIISVYLHGTHEIIKPRLGLRKHRYMNDSLLDSQIATLEQPADGIQVDINNSPKQIVTEILRRLPSSSEQR